MRATILTGILTLVTIIVFGQDVKVLQRDKISIEYPSDWVIRSLTSYLIVISEPAENETTFMPSFDIQEDTTFKTVDAFYNNYIKTMSSNGTFKNFKIISKGDISYKGFSAMELHCTAKAQNRQLEWKSIMFLKDNIIYKLTTTSPIERFYILERKTNEIFDSFKIQ